MDLVRGERCMHRHKRDGLLASRESIGANREPSLASPLTEGSLGRAASVGSKASADGVTMLYHVAIELKIPPEIDPRQLAEIRREETARSAEMQRQGKWVHLWRIVGRQASFSIFDVESHDELHQLLSSLPLYPYMDITVSALAKHPSAIERDA